MNLLAGQEERCKNREQTCGGSGEEDGMNREMDTDICTLFVVAVRSLSPAQGGSHGLQPPGSSVPHCLPGFAKIHVH